MANGEDRNQSGHGDQSQKEVDLTSEAVPEGQQDQPDVVDLTEEEKGKVPEGLDRGQLDFKEVEIEREKARGRLAVGLLWIIGIVVCVLLLFGGGVLFWGGAAEELAPKVEFLKELSYLLLTPLIAVFGTVTGFYYGAQRSS